MSDPYGERSGRPEGSGSEYGRPPGQQPVHDQETRARPIQSQQPPQGPAGSGPSLAKQPTYGQQYPASPYGQQYPASPYGQQRGYGSPYYGSPYGTGYQESPSNGLAIAALICSLCGIVACGIPAIAGIGLGIAALNQSNRTGAGRGLAIAGIVVGAVVLLLILAFGVVAVLVDGSSNTAVS